MNPRVLFVDEDQAHNGSTVSLEYLLDGFRSGGYDVDVLTWKIDPKNKTRMQESARVIDARSRLVRAITLHVHFAYVQSPFSPAGIRMILKDLVKLPAGILVVMRTIRRLKPDIVYANEYSVLQASIAAALCGVPAVMHIRSPLIRGKWGIRRRLVLRNVLAFNNAIFAISRQEMEQFHPRGRQKEKLRVIGEFVTGPSPGPEDQGRFREAFGFTPGRPVVSMLGGIRDIKGTLDFLRAAEILSAGGSGTQFVVAGNAHLIGTPEGRAYYDSCMDLVDRLQKKGTLRFLGNIPNPLELICASDIIVSPSTDSHFSRPVVEAWRMERPVVAVRTPHMEDLITHGVNGLLVDRWDEIGLAEAIGRLLADRGLRSELAGKGKLKARAEFDAQKNIGTILTVCASLLPGMKGSMA